MRVLTAAANPTEANQRELVAAVAEVRALLEAHGRREGRAERNAKPEFGKASPPRFAALCSTFGLSAFERAILLLTAGMELDAQFATACAAAQGDAARAYPTFSLALAALPEAHWSAITPAGPLRRWRLIECPAQPGTPLLAAPLRIDERVLHYLTGIRYLDERLAGLLQEIPDNGGEMAPSHEAVARNIATIWSGAEGPLPSIELCGGDEVTRRSIAAGGCATLALRVYALSADQIPSNPAELEVFVRLCERESALSSAAIYLETESLDRADIRSSAQVSRFLECVTSGVLLGTRDRWRALRRPAVTLEVRKPTPAEQANVWHELLAKTPAAKNGCVDALVSQFNLGIGTIRASVRAALAGNPEEASLAGAALGIERVAGPRAPGRPGASHRARRFMGRSGAAAGRNVAVARNCGPGNPPNPRL